jgi:hypothetical protein
MASPLQIRPRHQAVARALVDAFGVDTEEALTAIRYAAYAELGEFLAGGGPAHLFAFYQARDGSDADGESPQSASVAAAAAAAAATTTTTGGRHVTHAPRAHHAKRELYFGRSDRLAPGTKAVYFLRASPDGEPVDLDKVRRRTARGGTARCRASTGVDRSAAHAARFPSPPHRRRPIQHTQTTDGALVTGEVGADLLATLATTLTGLYAGHVAERTDWGKAEPEVRDAFRAEFASLATSLRETLDASRGVLELAPPPGGLNLADALRATQARAAKGAAASKKAVADAETVDALQSEWGVCRAWEVTITFRQLTSQQGAAPAFLRSRPLCTSPRTCTHTAPPTTPPSTFAELLETWCRQLEGFITAVEAETAGGAAPAVDAAAGGDTRRSSSAASSAPIAGPAAVIAFWRSRMRKLAAVSETLRASPTVTAAITVLTAVAHGPPERVPTAVVSGLRRWKELVMRVSEADNEASDSVRYLATLEPHLAPLYAADATPARVGDVLPALMSSLQTVHDIARYFASPARMADLFARLTPQMIAVCRAHILRACGGGGDDGDHHHAGGAGGGGGPAASLALWLVAPDDLLPRLEDVLQLDELYRETYRLTSEKAAATATAAAVAAAAAAVTSSPSVTGLGGGGSSASSSLYGLTGSPGGASSVLGGAGAGAVVVGLNTNLGRSFDFPESAVFGRFARFERRVGKLIALFTTLRSYRALEAQRLEGMAHITAGFNRLAAEFRARRHDLLAFDAPEFDRDFVELSSNLQGLEAGMHAFIHASFVSVPSVTVALDTLERFGRVFDRATFGGVLDDKAAAVFGLFATEIDDVMAEYEEHKHAPPKARNLPPVAGNIAWARHLLARLAGPMGRFTAWGPHIYTGEGARDGRRVVKAYNRAARVLVAYETLWLQSWRENVDVARGALQATLLVRFGEPAPPADGAAPTTPGSGRLVVNWDAEISQLVREAKCLERLGLPLPPSAREVLAQEGALKGAALELGALLRRHQDEVLGRVLPVLRPLLAPALADVNYRLQPGVTALTWTSLSLDAYCAHVAAGVARAEALVRNVNDIVEHRIEANLRAVARTLLVDLPSDRCFTLDEFVAAQTAFVGAQAAALAAKNAEVEGAVRDLLALVQAHAVDPHVPPVSEDACRKLVEHYNYFAYAALLMCAKNSLNALKRRVAARPAGGGGGGGAVGKPFFELDVTLAASEPHIRLTPALEDVQAAINRCATAVLGCFKHLFDWGQDDLPEDARETFFSRITRDLEVVRVVLLLTGSIQGTRKEVAACLAGYEGFRWLWADDADAAYREWAARAGGGGSGAAAAVADPVGAPAAAPTDAFAAELARFDGVDDAVAAAPPLHNIGALTLSTGAIKGQLRAALGGWRRVWTDALHAAAAAELAGVTDYLKAATAKLGRAPDSLDAIKHLMDTLAEVRGRECRVEALLAPLGDRYALLDRSLPEGYMSKDEMDNKAMLRVHWGKLRDRAGATGEAVAGLQAGFRARLLGDVRAFRAEVASFRDDFLRHGPMVKGVPPDVAMERLRRYEDELDIRARKRDLFCNGEALFGLPRTEYAALDATAKELGLLGRLYGLYKDVMSRMEEWRVILWSDTVANMPGMTAEMEAFASRARKMPKRLREWDAFVALRKRIEDFQAVLPLLQALSKPSIAPRHWEAVERVTGTPLPVHEPDFRLAQLLGAPLVEHLDAITEVCDGADKEQAIGRKLDEVEERWALAKFAFAPWKARGVPVLMGVGLVVEELEEAQMNLQTLLTMRHVGWFRERALGQLKALSDTCEALELWQKVQLLWCSLESVFLGGDIAKQMPAVAKKFQKIDKDFTAIQARAAEQAVVVPCCANELLRLSLPPMFEELERCQKSLEGYLEQKRNKFPRFYFVSNPVLLQILSQGSDPLAVQQYYEKIFDAISYVDHDKRDKLSIVGMVSREGRAEERIGFVRPVRVAGNIEDWLNDVLREMQRTMKARCAEAAAEVGAASADLSQLRRFVDGACGQYALLGLQLMWTADCEAALAAARRDRGALKAASKKALDVLNVLSGWCLQDLGSKMNRTKIETLVTIQVHQRDVIADIAAGAVRAAAGGASGGAGPSSKPGGRSGGGAGAGGSSSVAAALPPPITGADDFEWLKQARFYWEPGGRDFLDDGGACRVRVTDVPFEYLYEYLGCKERLVITPLTDRCYITLAQALGMFFGGAPAGPAGTGKTETGACGLVDGSVLWRSARCATCALSFCFTRRRSPASPPALAFLPPPVRRSQGHGPRAGHLRAGNQLLRLHALHRLRQDLQGAVHVGPVGLLRCVCARTVVTDWCGARRAVGCRQRHYRSRPRHANPHSGSQHVTSPPFLFQPRRRRRRVQPHCAARAVGGGAAGDGGQQRQEGGRGAVHVPGRPAAGAPGALRGLLHHHEPRLRG